MYVFMYVGMYVSVCVFVYVFMYVYICLLIYLQHFQTHKMIIRGNTWTGALSRWSSLSTFYRGT